MGDSYKSNATVGIRDGLVCITVSAPGVPDAVLRLPKGIALKMGQQILDAARRADASWPAPPAAQEGGDA